MDILSYHCSVSALTTALFFIGRRVTPCRWIFQCATQNCSMSLLWLHDTRTDLFCDSPIVRVRPSGFGLFFCEMSTNQLSSYHRTSRNHFAAPFSAFNSTGVSSWMTSILRSVSKLICFNSHSHALHSHNHHIHSRASWQASLLNGTILGYVRPLNFTLWSQLADLTFFAKEPCSAT